MGKIIGRYVVPHPPILIPEIGRGKEKEAEATLTGFATIGKEIAEKKPDTIIVISPHGPSFSDHFYITNEIRISGDMSQFGKKNLIIGFDNDPDLVYEIEKTAKRRGISVGPLKRSLLRQYGLKDGLDHGIIVPLYFINHFYQDYRLIPIATAGLGPKEHYLLGQTLQEILKQREGNSVIIASGDLSHKLKEDGPYGFDHAGPVFEKTIEALFRNHDGLGILEFDNKLRERAGQCGLDTFCVLLGTLDCHSWQSRVFSHEGPFGVGYMTAAIDEEEKTTESLLEPYRQRRDLHMEALKEKESIPQALARGSLTYYLETGKEMPLPTSLPPQWLEKTGGTFVSLKKDGQLRGCIGTIRPTQPSLAEEIIANAISAGTKDPRFPKVNSGELADIKISVDILGPSIDISGPEELDPQRYGVIVNSGSKRGLLLPRLEGITTVEEQVKVAKEKAGIRAWNTTTYQRFEVERYE